MYEKLVMQSKRLRIGGVTKSMVSLPDKALLASIRIFYQPVFRLADRRLEYVEVLARAAAHDGTISGPQTIVDAMTGAARSMRLTTSIMRRALDDYFSYEFGAIRLKLAFNLPLDVMLHADLLPEIERIRAEAGLPAQDIRFELTESHPVHDLQAAQTVVTSLRAAKYGLALDDIIPGMTNLPALMNMPISAIKLDRSVVISHTASDHEFIRKMTDHATSRDQDVIAEGIETEATLEKMQSLGVTHVQGYLLSHPLSAVSLQTFLRG